MDKQAIEQAAVIHAKSMWGDPIRGERQREYAHHSFIAGAEFATPKWISVNDGPPKHLDPDNANDHVHCLVVRRGDICHLAWNVYHVCWDDADMDDYFCDLLDVTHYLPLDSLPNPDK